MTFNKDDPLKFKKLSALKDGPGKENREYWFTESVSHP